MKLLTTLLFTLFLAGTIFADTPKSPRPDRYKDLYLRSAFTDPPIVKPPDAKPDDLPDWVLVGLSKYVDGVKVKLMNKKDRTRVTIPSKEATEMGFSIKEVTQDRNFIDDAVVTIRKGNNEGEVRFDPQFLVLKKVAGAPGGAKGSSKKTSSQTKRPPIPGRTTNPSSRSSKSPPLPGSVPRPSTGSQKTSTNGSTSTPSRRPRYIPRKK